MTVYEVHALTSPACIGGDYVKIADIKLLTKPVTSKFADTNLYFRHGRPQADYKYWPMEWRRGHKDAIFENTEEHIWGSEVPEGVWPETDEEAEKFFVKQITEYKFPFAWLLGEY